MRIDKGFTLLEIMISVAIIGILMAIAIPSYTGYVRRSACEDAKTVIIGAANIMESFRAQNMSYAGAALGTHSNAPVDGTPIFTIAISASTASTYNLTATPVAGGLMDGLGTITLSSTGLRGGTGTLAAAWNGCPGM